jgi:hypothetical protein
MKRPKERIQPKDVEAEAEPQVDEEIILEHEDKDETKRLLLLLGIIAALCIGFILWFSMTRDKPIKYETYDYNGFTFTKIEGLWHTQWQRGNNLYNVHLHYGPKESEDITIYRYGDNSFKINKTVYITFDPGNELGYIALASTELSLSLYNTFGIMPTGACTENITKPCAKMPIINCTNTDESVIYIRKADKTNVMFKDNCLVIEGKDSEIVRAANKVIWIWYGIIK